MEWVEQGKAPDTLPVAFTGPEGERFNRIICPYPSKAKYDGKGDVKSAESFNCV